MKNFLLHFIYFDFFFFLKAYPSDESATPERIEFRIKNAPEFFLLCFNDPQNLELIGFVNGTVTNDDNLKEDAMAFTHIPNGS